MVEIFLLRIVLVEIILTGTATKSKKLIRTRETYRIGQLAFNAIASIGIPDVAQCALPSD